MRITFFYSSCILIALWSPLLHAQETRPGQKDASSDPNSARVEYQKGNEAFRNQLYTQARHHYRQALKGEETFDVLCNLGRTEALLQEDVAALQHLTRCLELYPEESSLRGTRDKLEALRDEVRGRMTAEDVARAEAELEASRQSSASDAPGTEAQPADAEGSSNASLRSNQVAPPATPHDGSSARLPVSLAVGGVGLIGMGIGAGFLIHAGSVDSAAAAERERLGPGACRQNSSAECEELAGLVGESDDAFNVGVASVAVGGALIAGAVLTYLLWPDAQGGTAGRELLPYATVADPDGGGWRLGITGRF